MKHGRSKLKNQSSSRVLAVFLTLALLGLTAFSFLLQGVWGITSVSAAQKTTTLTVSNTIAGDSPDTTKEFSVTVTFQANSKDATISYTYSDDSTTHTLSKISKGSTDTVKITLKHGQSVTFTNIVESTSYSVTQTTDTDYETAYTLKQGDESQETYEAGTSVTAPSSDRTDTLAITNTPTSETVSTGTLNVKNTISGADDANTAFPVTVTFSAGEVDVTNAAIKYTEDGTEYTLPFTTTTTNDETGETTTTTASSVTAPLSLVHDENVDFTGIPEGVTYSVSQEAVDGYTTSYTLTAGSADPVTSAAAVTAQAAVAGQTDTVAITNTATAALNVKNTIVGINDTNTSFSVTVSFAAGTAGATISYTDASGTAQTLTFADDGTASVTLSLKGDESAAFTNIPAGVTYSVSQAENGVYTTTYQYTAGSAEAVSYTAGDSKTAVSGQTDTVEVVNTTIYPSLTISNTVVDANTTQEFSVSVTFTPGSSKATIYYTEDNADKTIQLTAGGDAQTVALSLAAGESVTFTGLQTNMSYSVSQDAANGYATTYTITKGTAAEEYTAGDSVATAASRNDTVAITNTAATGTLVVTNTMTGGLTEATEKTFLVDVTFTADDSVDVSSAVISYTDTDTQYSDSTSSQVTTTGSLTFDSTTKTCTATIRLVKDESVTFTGIPGGVTYRVIEQKSSGTDTSGNTTYSNYTDEGYITTYTLKQGDGEAVSYENTGTPAVAGRTDTVTIINNTSTGLDSDTYTAFVYVCRYGYNADGGRVELSDDCLELLGIDESTIDGNYYFPAGEITLSKSVVYDASSYLNVHYWGTGADRYGPAYLVPGCGLITASNWSTIQEALKNIDTTTLIDETENGTTTEYTLNQNNSIGTYANQVYLNTATDYGMWNGLQKTSLHRWNDAIYGDYGFEDMMGTYHLHLDLTFNVCTIKFVLGDNGISDSTTGAVDGTQIDTRTYITGSTILAPRSLSIPDGYTFAGYYTDAACSDENEWNGIGTALNEDTTVYIKLAKQEEAVINYKVAIGQGSLSSYAETLVANDVNATATGSTATASSGWKFAGWYTDIYCTVPANPTPSYVRLDNPLYNSGETDEVTIRMNVKLTGDGTDYNGLLSFRNTMVDSGFFGISGNGSIHYNKWDGTYNDLTNQSAGRLTNDGEFHDVTIHIKKNGNIEIKVDSKQDAKYTVDADRAASMIEFITSQPYIYLNYLAGEQWGDWGGVGATFSQVEIKGSSSNVDTIYTDFSSYVTDSTASTSTVSVDSSGNLVIATDPINETLVPTSPETTGVWLPASEKTYTYYAKFVSTTQTVRITKSVAGNLGDKSKLFKFTVACTGEITSLYSSDKTLSNDALDTGSTTTATLYLHDGETVTLIIPEGATITVTEECEDYTPACTGATVVESTTDSSGDVTALTGTISGVLATATMTFTNTKEGTITTIISMNSTPYLLLLAAVGVPFAVGVAVMAKKRREEE